MNIAAGHDVAPVRCKDRRVDLHLVRIILELVPQFRDPLPRTDLPDEGASVPDLLLLPGVGFVEDDDPLTVGAKTCPGCFAGQAHLGPRAQREIADQLAGHDVPYLDPEPVP